MLFRPNHDAAYPADLFWPNTALNVPQDSIAPHAALYASQLIFLLAPPFRGRRELFLSIIVCLGIYAQLHPYFSDDPGKAQPATISWSYYLATLEKFLSSDRGAPERGFWRVDRGAGEAISFSSFGLAKLRWATMLIFNQRGVRWNYQVKNVPEVLERAKTHAGEDRGSRGRFLRSRLLEVIWKLLAADLMFQLGIRILFTPPEESLRGPGEINSKYLTMRHVNPLWQLAKCFVFGALPYYMVSAQYAVFGIVAVASNLSAPADWPPLFGRLADCTTVRVFWGRFWHQQLRRLLTVFSRWAVGKLGIRRGSTLGSYGQLWLAFCISGFFHARSQLSMPSPVNITDGERCNGFFVFFLWQAAAITFEDFVYWCFRKLGGKERIGAATWSARRLIGYCWVVAVLWHSLPNAGDTFLRMRIGAEDMLPFTVWRPVVERYVPIPPLMLNNANLG